MSHAPSPISRPINFADHAPPWREVSRCGRARGWVRVAPGRSTFLYADSAGITFASHVAGELEARVDAARSHELDELEHSVDSDTRAVLRVARGHVDDCRTTDAIVGRIVLELLERAMTGRV